MSLRIKRTDSKVNMAVGKRGRSCWENTVEEWQILCIDSAHSPGCSPCLLPHLLPWSPVCRLSSAQLRLKEQNRDFSCCLLLGRWGKEFELSPNMKLNEHFWEKYTRIHSCYVVSVIISRIQSKTSRCTEKLMLEQRQPTKTSFPADFNKESERKQSLSWNPGDR